MLALRLCILPKQVICLISPVGWVHLFALSAGLRGAWRMVIVLPRRGPAGRGKGGSTCVSTLESPENTFGAGRAGRGRIAGTPLPPDRHVGGVCTPWGEHHAEAFSAWSNVSNYAASVNPGPLTTQRGRENSLAGA